MKNKPIEAEYVLACASDSPGKNGGRSVCTGHRTSPLHHIHQHVNAQNPQFFLQKHVWRICVIGGGGWRVGGVARPVLVSVYRVVLQSFFV